MRTITKRLLVMITLILVIGALGLLARRFGTLEWIVENETRMRDFVGNHPWQGWFLGLVIYTAFSLIPATAGKSVVIGWIFGFWQAVLMVDIGLTIAALGGFFAARFLIRDLVRNRFKRIVEKLDRHLGDNAAFYLLMMRLAHVPYSAVNYCAGASSVPAKTFCWTTAAGILPGTMIFAFVGARIPTLATISENGVWSLLDPLLYALLAATIIFPVVIRWAVLRFRAKTGSDSAIDLSALETLDPWSEMRQTDGAH